MTKKPNLTDLTSQYSAQSTINGNNSKIEASFENTLSLDGSSPNSMQADFDLNSNDLLNGKGIYADRLILNGSVVTPATEIVLTSMVATNVSVVDTAGYFVGTNVETILAEIGADFSNFQPLDAGLTSIAALTTAVDQMIYTSALDVYATTPLTAAGRALLDDADASAQRTTLGLGTFAVENTADYVQSQATWDAGIDTTESTITAAKLKGVIDSSTLLTSPTAIATTSGTGILFTDIPAGVREISVLFSAVDLSGSDKILVQIGDSGGIEVSGYDSRTFTDNVNSSSTSGFIMQRLSGFSAGGIRGVLSLIRDSNTGNVWYSSSSFATGTLAGAGGGTKTLSGELTQLQITRTGTNTFTSGSVNIAYR